MMETDLTIGALARQTGTNVQTIRYYEQIGLLRQPSRTRGNQRRYSARDARRLSFIRHARALGFPLDSVRALLALADDPDQPCEAADAIAQHHLRDVENRLRSLMALRDELKRMIRQCAGGRVGDCRVIEVLADHSECLSDEHSAIV